MDELAKAYVKIIPTTDGIRAALTKELSGAGISAAGVTAGNLIASGIMSALSGIGSFVADSITAGAEFEKAMSEVKAISGATGDEFIALEEKAKQMGATTKFTASESAEAFKYMAMAGWGTEEMLNGIEGIMNLAAASGVDLAQTSDIVTDALTAFGLKAEDATHFADVLAATSANANTNVDLMGETFKYVAPVAGAMGYSIEDVALAIGLMANSAVKGSMAGTSLRSLLTRLADPTKQTQEAMDALGVSLTDDEGKMYTLGELLGNLRAGFQGGGMDANDFAAAMAELQESYDAGTLSAEEYEEGVEKLSTAMYGVDAAQKAAFASDLAGKYGMAGMLSIVTAGAQDYNDLQAAIEGADGAAQEMADTMQDNLAGDMKILESAVEGAQIAIAEELTPTMRDFVQTGQEEISRFTEILKTEGTEPALKELGEFSGEAVAAFIDKIPDMIETGVKFLGAFAEGVEEALPEISEALERTGAKLLEMLWNGLIGSFKPTGGGLLGLITGSSFMPVPTSNEDAYRYTYDEGLGGYRVAYITNEIKAEDVKDLENLVDMSENGTRLKRMGGRPYDAATGLSW